MGVGVSKHEMFWEACGFGHTEKVRRYIEGGINVNWVSYTHTSCAIHVASQGKPEIVRMLLNAGCDVNVKDERGSLALHHAAMKGHARIAQTLLDGGSQIDIQDKNGWTPLLNAAYWCWPDAVEVLIKNKCDVNLQNKDERTALHEACRSQTADEEGLTRIVQLLIRAGCDINLKSSDIGEADFTPLMFSAYHGHPGAAQALVDAGCDINAVGTNKWSALHWAADHNQKQIVETLLHARVNVMQADGAGDLAFNRARNPEIKSMLEEAILERRNELRDDSSDEDEGDGTSAFDNEDEDEIVAEENTGEKESETILGAEESRKDGPLSPDSGINRDESDYNMMSISMSESLHAQLKNSAVPAPLAGEDDLAGLDKTPTEDKTESGDFKLEIIRNIQNEKAVSQAIPPNQDQGITSVESDIMRQVEVETKTTSKDAGTVLESDCGETRGMLTQLESMPTTIPDESSNGANVNCDTLNGNSDSGAKDNLVGCCIETDEIALSS